MRKQYKEEEGFVAATWLDVVTTLSSRQASRRHSFLQGAVWLHGRTENVVGYCRRTSVAIALLLRSRLAPDGVCVGVHKSG